MPTTKKNIFSADFESYCESDRIHAIFTTDSHLLQQYIFSTGSSSSSSFFPSSSFRSYLSYCFPIHTFSPLFIFFFTSSLPLILVILSPSLLCLRSFVHLSVWLFISFLPSRFPSISSSSCSSSSSYSSYSSSFSSSPLPLLVTCSSTSF